MFQNINFFTNNKNVNNSKNLQIQELFILYKIYLKVNKSKPNLNFKDFFILLKLFSSNFKYVGDLKTLLFLILLFLNKTNNTIFVEKLNNKDGLLFGKNILNYYSNNNNDLILNKFSFFWKRWKNLKRPKTSLNFNEYFISNWSDKITKYVKVGLINNYNSFFFFKSSLVNILDTKVNINKTLLTVPKYSSSSINKLLDVNTLNDFEFQYLRKNKVYNKGRYSRCRQNYRTGVYMCMYLSVVSIFGLYYWFYKFSFNFTYLWWLFIAFLGSFFLPKIIKYRLYEPTTLFNKFFDFFKWVFLLLKTLFF